jgi:hypothetical protein
LRVLKFLPIVSFLNWSNLTLQCSIHLLWLWKCSSIRSRHFA